MESLSANPNVSAKLMPAALKWCAHNVGALHTLLLPPPRPRVTYGDGAEGAGHGAGGGGGGGGDPWGRRLGARRLAIVRLLERLVVAKRPLLTSAIAESRPCVLLAAVHLLHDHPSSAVR